MRLFILTFCAAMATACSTVSGIDSTSFVPSTTSFGFGNLTRLHPLKTDPQYWSARRQALLQVRTGGTLPPDLEQFTPVVDRIMAKLPEEYRLVGVEVRFDNCAGLNAEADPAGVIFICADALYLSESEAQLAWIIYHEYAHIYYWHFHSNDALGPNFAGVNDAIGNFGRIGDALAGQSLTEINNFQFSLKDEKSADKFAFFALRDAGYSVEEVRGLLEVQDGIVPELSSEEVKKFNFAQSFAGQPVPNFNASSAPSIIAARLDLFERVTSGPSFAEAGLGQDAGQVLDADRPSLTSRLLDFSALVRVHASQRQLEEEDCIDLGPILASVREASRALTALEFRLLAYSVLLCGSFYADDLKTTLSDRVTLLPAIEARMIRDIVTGRLPIRTGRVARQAEYFPANEEAWRPEPVNRNLVFNFSEEHAAHFHFQLSYLQMIRAVFADPANGGQREALRCREAHWEAGWTMQQCVFALDEALRFFKSRVGEDRFIETEQEARSLAVRFLISWLERFVPNSSAQNVT